MGEQVCPCVSTGAHRARRALDPPELQLQEGRALDPQNCSYGGCELPHVGAKN